MLETKNLTMRFGGLTAVNAVDLRVERGQIFAVIGPNGAGKTTLFNAITGIYEPTTGSVAFDGHSLRKALTWKVIASCAAIGLLIGVIATLLAINVNKFWRAAVVRTSVGSTEPFNNGRMWDAMQGYLVNDLVIERIPRSTRYRVIPADYKDDDKVSLILLEVPTEGEAKTARDKLRELSGLAGTPRVEAGHQEGTWAVLDPSGSNTYATADSRAEAEELVRHLAATRIEGERRPRVAATALLIGFLVGGLGAFAVWNRSRRTADGIALGGIARTFQNIRLFQNMSVLENVLIGMNRSFRRHPVEIVLRLPAATREEAEHCTAARSLLDYVGLASKEGSLAKNLPYGDQRRLEIARALATEPRLLLLDEPAAGMNPKETVDLMALIRRIRDRGVTVLLIEHHMSLVMGISDRIAVLDYGVKIAEGSPQEVKNDPKVIEAYLGKEEVS